MSLDQFIIRTPVNMFFCAELTVDDSAQEEIRSKLWDDFNNAWLALMHKQMTLTGGLLEAGITLQQPQLMTAEVIKKMCSDLIKLNDDFLEKHGLVNYQYGVLEDQIIESKSIWNMLMLNLFFV